MKAINVIERESLINQMFNLLEDYSYHPSREGVAKVIDAWDENKADIILDFKKHPKYNGNFQIPLSNQLTREQNIDFFYDFERWIENHQTWIDEQYDIIYPRIKRELDRIVSDLSAYVYSDKSYEPGALTMFRQDGVSFVFKVTEYNTLTDKTEAYYLFKELLGKYFHWNSSYLGVYTKDDEYIVTRESCEKVNDIRNIINKFVTSTEQFIDEDDVKSIESILPNVRPHNGQKRSRVLQKICNEIGVNTSTREWNQKYATYCDNINPLKITQWTVLSCHPCDYLTMSFGNSLASCHTIDKHNKRGMPNSYSGCYSSGTESYMLDESSIVYYTVDAKYSGNNYETQDKITRCMFHLGEEKILQARMYPQGSIGYKEPREIVQKIISEMWNVPNYWTNVKGTGECSSVTRSSGTHYRDYTERSECNVSYLKNEEGTKNKKIIYIGHDPICPSCGKEHSYDESIECEYCYSGMRECECCGNSYYEDDMCWCLDVNEWRCFDCSFYCDYHQIHEACDDYNPCSYVRFYGNVCEDALENSGKFELCEHCGEWHEIENMIVTEDDRYFCDSRCADIEGYIELDGAWYPNDDVYTCPECGALTHTSDYNHELDMCNDCASHKEEESEE